MYLDVFSFSEGLQALDNLQKINISGNLIGGLVKSLFTLQMY